MKEIPGDGHFDPESRLVSLACRDCLVSSIPSGAFRQFPNLREIHLSHSGIFYISNLALEGLQNLKHLDLSFNSLTSLYSNSLINVKSTLQELLVNNNKIDEISLTDIQVLQMMKKLQTFEYHSNSIFCSCDLFYIHQLMEYKSISSQSMAYYCYRKPNFLSLDQEKAYLQSNCPAHYYPIITNLTSLDCSSVAVAFLHEPFAYNVSVRTVYTILIGSASSAEVRREQTIGKSLIIRNLEPRVTHQITVLASNQNENSGSQDKPTQFMITQYIKNEHIFECKSSNPKMLSETGSSNFVYNGGIITAIAVSLTAFIAMISAVFLYLCRISNANLAPNVPFTTAQGFNEFHMIHQPVLTQFETNETTYPSLKGTPQPRCTSEILRKQILANPCIKVVKHENIGFNGILKSGKFGTMYSAEAFMIKPEEYHSKITVLEFSQRTVVERTGRKLEHYCNLIHPNIMNVLGIQETTGPLALILDYVPEYLDLKNFLMKMQQKRSLTQNTDDPIQVLSLTVAQVISGLSYMSQNGFVHGDISARSCLVTTGFQVKIAFTGAQIDCYPNEYLKTGNRFLPIRWMSWEAIQFGSYSFQSDIWSFGILIYEIFTYGETPYKHLKDVEVANLVTEQRGSLASFPKPVLCPDEIWKIAEDCWHYRPEGRITANGVENRLLHEVWNISITELDEMSHSEIDSESGLIPMGLMKKMNESATSYGIAQPGTGYNSTSDDDDTNESANNSAAFEEKITTKAVLQLGKNLNQSYV